MGGMQIAAGASLVAGGSVMVANMVRPMASAFAVAAPMVAATAWIGMAVSFISLAVMQEDKHKKLQQASDKQGAQFIQWGKDGLLEEDWDDKLEYWRYSIAEYGSSAQNYSESIWDTHAKEFEFFKNTPAEGGSSINRLNPELHDA
jgi:hypothetical protein